MSEQGQCEWTHVDGEGGESEEQLEALDRLSKATARSAERRSAFWSLGREQSERLQRISTFWQRIVQSCLDEELTEEARQLRLRKGALLARIVRNAVVDNVEGQSLAFDVAPNVLSTLRLTTSFTLETDADVQLLMRTIVQMLSNIVTENDNLQQKLFANDATADVLCRLLRCPDPGTQSAAQVLLVNMTLSSPRRTQSLTSEQTWTPVAQSLLHIIDVGVEEDEAEEEDEEAERTTSDGDSGYGISFLSTTTQERKQARMESLGVINALFVNIFRLGLFDELYKALAAPSQTHSSNVDVSLITASQVTLLKLLDAYLYDGNVRGASVQSLPSIFVHLARWAARTMHDVLSRGPTAPVDGRLVEVHVGFILLLQCLMSVAMASEKEEKTEEIVHQIRSDDFVVTLIDLMRTTSAFSPAVSPFKPTTTTSVDGSSALPTSAPDGHVLSSTGRAALSQPATDRPRLDKLKRDLVGLLGVIAFRRGKHDDDDVRRVQDVVRTRGGLLVVLNLTQMDERNPYIRERAIFALRNLLQGNQASQDVVAQLKPLEQSTQ